MSVDMNSMLLLKLKKIPFFFHFDYPPLLMLLLLASFKHINDKCASNKAFAVYILKSTDNKESMRIQEWGKRFLLNYKQFHIQCFNFSPSLDQSFQKLISDGSNYVWSLMFDCSNLKIGCSIIKRWTRLSSFDDRKMVLESVRWVI